MATSVLFRYYQCENAGIGLIIYPELRSATDQSILWNGQADTTLRYSVAAGTALSVGMIIHIQLTSSILGNSTLIDLTKLNIEPGTPVMLSQSTVFGNGYVDASQILFFDQQVNTVAIGTRTGGPDDGGFFFNGLKEHSAIQEKGARAAFPSPLQESFDIYGSSYAVETLRQALNSQNLQSDSTSDAISDIFTAFWAGVGRFVAQATPTSMGQSIAVITLAMVATGYQVRYENLVQGDGTRFVRFYFGPRRNNLPGDSTPDPKGVPADLQTAWNNAFKKAGKDIINDGIKQI